MWFMPVLLSLALQVPAHDGCTLYVTEQAAEPPTLGLLHMPDPAPRADRAQHFSRWTAVSDRSQADEVIEIEWGDDAVRVRRGDAMSAWHAFEYPFARGAATVLLTAAAAGVVLLSVPLVVLAPVGVVVMAMVRGSVSLQNAWEDLGKSALVLLLGPASVVFVIGLMALTGKDSGGPSARQRALAGALDEVGFDRSAGACSPRKERERSTRHLAGPYAPR